MVLVTIGEIFQVGTTTSPHKRTILISHIELQKFYFDLYNHMPHAFRKLDTTTNLFVLNL